jgi:hypothetical protein
MMLKCRECDRVWDWEKDEDDTPHFIPKVCPPCGMDLFKQDMEHSKKNSKEMSFLLSPGWEAEVYNAPNCHEEGQDFLFIDIHMNKGKKGISIGIKKRGGNSDEFLVWMGDKQFVVRMEEQEEDSSENNGIVISTHDPKEFLDPDDDDNEE